MNYKPEKIRQLRKEKGLTQKQLGEVCGMKESQVRKYELGNGNPKFETIKKFADALGVDPSELYDEPAQAAAAVVRDVLEKGEITLEEYVPDDVKPFRRYLISLGYDVYISIEGKIKISKGTLKIETNMGTFREVSNLSRAVLDTRLQQLATTERK